MCCIRDVGGLTIAQEPDTAGQPGMPTSAIASGCIDFVLAPEDIGRKIASLSKTGGRDGAPSRKEKLP